MNMKLYRVYVNFSEKGEYAQFESAFVIASGLEKAYSTYRAYLDEMDIGSVRGRALDKVVLIAEFPGSEEGKSLVLLEKGSYISRYSALIEDTVTRW